MALPLNKEKLSVYINLLMLFTYTDGWVYNIKPEPILYTSDTQIVAYEKEEPDRDILSMGLNFGIT